MDSPLETAEADAVLPAGEYFSLLRPALDSDYRTHLCFLDH